MSTRETVLGKIRKSLRVDANDAARRAAVSGRIEGAPKGVIPARGQLPPAERVALFQAMAEKVSATVARVGTPDQVPEAVGEYLRGHNLPAALRMGDDPRLTGLAWQRTAIAVSRGPSDGNDAVAISHAQSGVAESGTLVLTSGHDNPTTLNFLPEAHVVVLTAADVVGDYEALWALLRQRFGKGVLPRTVNMVTGPSRSADIEQTLLLGAHGPRRLHIIIVG